MRRCFLLLLIVLSISMLKAQETGGIIPITMLLEGADYAASSEDDALRTVWRPDWPVQVPVDAFKVLHGEVSRVIIEGEGIALSLSFGPEGLLQEFPFMLNGRMAQVGLIYDEFSRKKEIHLIFPSGDEPYRSIEESWKLEILEYDDSFPYLIRASRLGVWYFIYFSRTMGEIIETWYDVRGNFLGAFAYSFIKIGDDERISAMWDYFDPDGGTKFYYDSRGLLTDAIGPAGLYKVLYFREDLPRYWERWPVGETSSRYGADGKFAFQWDETGFIPRVTGESGDGLFDYRYEYDVDERGNWIERREIKMIRWFDLLFPTPGFTYKRILEYRE